MKFLRLPGQLVWIIVVNLIPLSGIFLFHWEPQAALSLYLVEVIILGSVNISKILVSASGGIGRIFTAGFFLVHFGGFTAFMLFMASGATDVFCFVNYPETWVFLIIMIIIGAMDVVRFYMRNKNENDYKQLMLFPYSRIVIPIVVFAVFENDGKRLDAAGAGITIALMIIAKTGFDLYQVIKNSLKAISQ